MATLRPFAVAFGACLLQACAAPQRQEMLFQPAQQVRHSANQSAASYYQVGRYHQERGDLELALTAYNYSIARDGGQLEARSAAAAIHAQQGRLDQAKAMLLAVVADFPAVALPYNNLGYVYYLQGDYVAAAATLRKALALEAGNDRARNNLRLAETALAHPDGLAAAGPVAVRAAPAPMPAPILAATPVALPPPAVQATAMDIVEHAPNFIELKRRTVAPAVLASAAGVVTAPVLPARVEIANGNGITGMARRIRLALGRQGIVVHRLTNARPFNQVDTTIEYRGGHEQHAQQLRDALRSKAVLVVGANLPAQADLRLVLGKDARVQFAAINVPDDKPVLSALLPPDVQLEFPQ